MPKVLRLPWLGPWAQARHQRPAVPTPGTLHSCARRVLPTQPGCGPLPDTRHDSGFFFFFFFLVGAEWGLAVAVANYLATPR